MATFSQDNNRSQSRKARFMAMKAGVWIDPAQAIVVLITEASVSHLAGVL
jgi:hypothetical protein